MKNGVILVHGYTGSPDNWGAVAEHLRQDPAVGTIEIVNLGGGAAEGQGVFDLDEFVGRIVAVAEKQFEAGGEVVLVSHSTGGSLALAALGRLRRAPRLLVLAATPRSIAGDFAQRWLGHAGADRVALRDVAHMVRCVNLGAAEAVAANSPILVLHGTDDQLVPVEQATGWAEGRSPGTVRVVLVPGAGHHLFEGPHNGLALDVLGRAVGDALAPPGDDALLGRLGVLEQGLSRFLAVAPFSGRHLAQCPSALAVAGSAPAFAAVAGSEPVLANIEITTACNMACAACARAIHPPVERHMTRDVFNRVLDLLPHAFGVTMVGLGEPLLHPEVGGLVADAVARGRSVGIVTNAACLDREAGRALLRAGIDRMTFSVDAVEPDVAKLLGRGADVERVRSNIAVFLEEVRQHTAAGNPPPTLGVFCAVSTRNAHHLAAVVDRVAELGLPAVMVSDLNFGANADWTLWRGADAPMREAVERGIKRGLARGVLVLSVHGLEHFGLRQRWRGFLLRPAAALWERSTRHTHCASPWQTLPIDVTGKAAICDCQSETDMGNILEQPLQDIWNGQLMREQRRAMRSAQPPGACALCPRF